MNTSQAIPPSLNLVILGSGGHAVSVADIALANGFKITCFVDPAKNKEMLLTFPVIENFHDLKDFDRYSYCVAIGDNFIRERVVAEIRTIFPGAVFPKLVHPAAVVSGYSTVEEGSVVMPGAIIGPCSRIGRFCIVNTNSSVDHDGFVSDFVSIAPGAVIGGVVRIGRSSSIAIGAVVKQCVAIGERTIVGANSYLNTDLADGVVSYGTPARIIREHETKI